MTQTKSTRKRRGHGEGSIYRRKDGRWVGALSVDSGRRKYYYGDTRAEVQAKLTAASAALNNGIMPSRDDRLTIGQFLKDWLDNSVKPSVRGSTFRGYESKVRTHIIPSLGRLPLAGC